MARKRENDPLPSIPENLETNDIFSFTMIENNLLEGLLWDRYRKVFTLCKEKNFYPAIAAMQEVISGGIVKEVDHGICRCYDQIFAQSRRAAAEGHIAQNKHVEIAQQLHTIFIENISSDLAKDPQAQAPRSLLLYKSAFDAESVEELAKESIPRTEVNFARAPWALFRSVIALCKQDKPDFNKALAGVEYDVTNLIICDREEIQRACDQISMFASRILTKEECSTIQERIEKILPQK
jgi:hypothetical protein